MALRADVVVWGVVGLAIVSTTAVVAGPLDPPSGPIAPTGKTLTAVEPRIAISDANTPGDASASFVIDEPGSYYLTGDVVVPAGRDGIRVTAHDVTIDLSGFTLRWTGSSITLDNGIEAPGRSGLVVRDGRITGFRGNGITAGADATVEGVAATDNFFGAGLNLGARALVRSCAARDNSGSGIVVGAESRVVDSGASGNGQSGFELGAATIARGCVASGNASRGFFGNVRARYEACTARDNNFDGFFGGNGSLATGCISEGNSGDGFRFGGGALASSCSSTSNQGDGFELLRSSTVRDCAADANNGSGFRLGDDGVIIGSSGSYSTGDGLFATDGVTVERCTFAENGDNGIEIGTGSTIRGNTLRNNAGCGVFAGSENIIEDNVATGHDLGAPGDFQSSIGILVQGDACRIDGNHSTGNGQGVRVVGVNNVIVRNSVAGNSVNIASTSGNNDAPLTGVFGAGPWNNIE